MTQYPVSVDLRQNYEQTYNQGSDNACGAFAVCNALDVMYERATGKPHRFDTNYTWHYSKLSLGLVGNYGSTHDSLKDSLEIHGAKLGDNVIKGFSFVRTHSDANKIKELLCLGVPVIWLMKVCPNFDNRNNGKPWKEHVWNDFDTSLQYAMHYVCIVGYDDVSEMYLMENSWGSYWGDGGFFGISYADFNKLTEGISHIDIALVLNKPVKDFKMKAYLRWSEASDFVDRSKTGLKELISSKLESGKVQDVIDFCNKLGISDKHLEYIFDWDRGTVRIYKQNNQNFNWNGFVFDQL